MLAAGSRQQAVVQQSDGTSWIELSADGLYHIVKCSDFRVQLFRQPGLADDDPVGQLAQFGIGKCFPGDFGANSGWIPDRYRNLRL